MLMAVVRKVTDCTQMKVCDIVLTNLKNTLRIVEYNYDDQELSYHIEQLNQSDSNDNSLTTICDVDSKYYEMEDMQHISPKTLNLN